MILLFKINISLICYNKKSSMMVRYCSYNITRSEGGVKKNTENIVNQSTCMVSAPPMMMGGDHSSGPVWRGVCFFIWTVGRLLHMGWVTIRDFPGGTPVPISCPIGKWRTKSIKVNLTNCHREVCRIKFYQIVTSHVLTSLWKFDKMLFW